MNEKINYPIGFYYIKNSTHKWLSDCENFVFLFWHEEICYAFTKDLCLINITHAMSDYWFDEKNRLSTQNDLIWVSIDE